ncbi:ISL3 family transposase [Burkholderia pseudomallei]|nr:transposase family protein [Burkholderia pseudomallei]
MLDRKALQALGCWTGYRLERVEWPQGDSRTLSLYLKPVSQIMYCEQCGARCQQIHETTVRRVRDLPLFEYRVVLHVPRRRVWCERCGAARLEKLDWLGRYQRVTERFAKACEKLLQAASVQAVAAFYELGWHTVKSIDKMRLRARVAEPDWSTIRYLAMDEFALHKGHRYATVVVDPIGRQVLWVGPGRSRETARAFFEQLPEGVAERIEAVAIDMTTAYELEIKEQCPQAEIVFDLYHVVAKYGREVIDRVRVDQANQLRHDKPARKVLKSSRWLLLRNRHNLKPEQAVHLKELLAANQSLLCVYVLRDELKRLWFYRKPACAEKAWGAMVRTGSAKRDRRLAKVRPALAGLLARNRGPLPPSAQYQRRRRHQQHDQGHQAPRLRVPRRAILLPQDPRRVPRDSAMNRKKAHMARASDVGSACGSRVAHAGQARNRCTTGAAQARCGQTLPPGAA